MSARYAVYYAPDPTSQIWGLACAWLGRDPHRKLDCRRPALPALADLDLERLTASPRGYGFHATLKAPFELVEGRSEPELLDFAEGFARQRQPFSASISPQALGRFLAFRLDAPCPEMSELAEACVRAFDPFRAPLSDFDIARRRRSGLSPAQDMRMLEWGYPYIFEDFRFHMTLTNGIEDEALRSRVLDALRQMFAYVSGVHRFDAVAIYRQSDRDAPFEVVERFSFYSATAPVGA
jgi:putative phosphonate metabolism protein